MGSDNHHPDDGDSTLASFIRVSGFCSQLCHPFTASSYCLVCVCGGGEVGQEVMALLVRIWCFSYEADHHLCE